MVPAGKVANRTSVLPCGWIVTSAAASPNEEALQQGGGGGSNFPAVPVSSSTPYRYETRFALGQVVNDVYFVGLQDVNASPNSFAGGDSIRRQAEGNRRLP